MNVEESDLSLFDRLVPCPRAIPICRETSGLLDAIAASRRLAREEGLFVGVSSGANVLGAVETARQLGPRHTVVTMLPDRGERYLSLEG